MVEVIQQIVHPSTLEPLQRLSQIDAQLISIIQDVRVMKHPLDGGTAKTAYLRSTVPIFQLGNARCEARDPGDVFSEVLEGVLAELKDRNIKAIYQIDHTIIVGGLSLIATRIRGLF